VPALTPHDASSVDNTNAKRASAGKAGHADRRTLLAAVNGRRRVVNVGRAASDAIATSVAVGPRAMVKYRRFVAGVHPTAPATAIAVPIAGTGSTPPAASAGTGWQLPWPHTNLTVASSY